MAIEIEIKRSLESSTATKIRYGAPYPGLSIESIKIIPAVAVLPYIIIEIHRKVNHHHLVIRRTAEKSFHTLRIPDITLISEHPTLHNPYCIWIGSRHSLIDSLAVMLKFVVTLL